MMVDIVVPQIGEAVAELLLFEWYKEQGDTVAKGDPLFSIDSDKTVVEVEAFEDGVLAEILQPAGSSVLPHDVVARLSTDSPVSRGERVTASPRARRAARDRGIDLAGLSGHGVRNMVVLADLESSQPRPTPHLRTVIAQRMAQSKREIPHFYVRSEIDMGAAVEWRSRSGEAVSFTAMVVKACAIALSNTPEVCVRYTASGPANVTSPGVGVAVAVPTGVLAPTVAQAHSGSLAGVSSAIAEVASRARSGTLRQSDTAEKLMVVSNLGMYGVEAFSAIIEPGDSMVLAVGGVAERVVARNGAVVVSPTMIVTLSVDHRVIDGAPAAAFLREVKQLMEDPERLAAQGDK